MKCINTWCKTTLRPSFWEAAMLKLHQLGQYDLALPMLIWCTARAERYTSQRWQFLEGAWGWFVGRSDVQGGVRLIWTSWIHSAWKGHEAGVQGAVKWSRLRVPAGSTVSLPPNSFPCYMSFPPPSGQLSVGIFSGSPHNLRIAGGCC